MASAADAAQVRLLRRWHGKRCSAALVVCNSPHHGAACTNSVPPSGSVQNDLAMQSDDEADVHDSAGDDDDDDAAAPPAANAPANVFGILLNALGNPAGVNNAAAFARIVGIDAAVVSSNKVRSVSSESL